MSSSSSKTVADYPDAVRRILDADVDPQATTRDEIESELRNSTAPQITEKVARDLADAALSEERVIEAIESTGELPRAGELEAITNVSDDYEMDDRRASVLEAIRERVATVEDVEQAVARDRPVTRAEAQATVDGIGKEIRGAESRDVANGIVTVEDVVESPQTDPSTTTEGIFREDVETAAQDLSDQSEIADSSDRVQDVTREASREIGAPERSEFEKSRAQAVATADQVTPSDVLDDTQAQTPVSVIRDESGEAIAATGGPSGETGERVAEEIGVEYRSQQEVVDSMQLEQGGGEAALSISGRRISEVDVE